MNIFNRRLRVLGVATGLLLGLGQIAAADPIGPDCDTCQGAIFTLESFLLDNNPTEDLYAIRLTMNTAGLTTAPDPAFAIDSVAVKTTAQTMPGSTGSTYLRRPAASPAGTNYPAGSTQPAVTAAAVDSSAKTGSALE